MPFGFTFSVSLLNAFFNFNIVSLDISLSTYTMALFKSPPLIKLLSNNISNSCRKLKVLAFAISLLNSESEFIVAFWVPKTLVPKSTIAVI
jgi:hypothetical protein